MKQGLSIQEFKKKIEFKFCPSDCPGGQHVCKPCSYIIGEIPELNMKVKFHGHRSQLKNREVVIEVMYYMYMEQMSNK